MYKETNLINGKFYIGAHQTEDLGDWYRGSGKYLVRAQIKYGMENFQHTIVAFCRTEQEMYETEFDLISTMKPHYNLHEGGKGGWKNNNKIIDMTSRNRKIASGRNYRDPVYLKKLSDTTSEAFRNDPERSRKISEANRGNTYRLGSTQSDNTKKAIGMANSISQLGERNSGHGKIWVYHPINRVNKRINPLELSNFQLEGYIKGRNMSFYENWDPQKSAAKNPRNQYSPPK